MKKLIYLLALAVVIGVGVFIALWNSGKKVSPAAVQSVQSGKIQVVTSFYPLYFFAKQIGGDKVDVTNIVPSGAEPHDYEPTSQDMAMMERSRLIVLNGGGLEAWGDNIKKNVDTKNTTIVVAGDGLTTQEVKENDQVMTDPHVWLDPPLAKKMVERIAQGFERVDSLNRDYYKANADALESKLDDLNAIYGQGLSSCAEKNIITSHAAFGYLATTYGLNQVSIAGLSPDAEPSPSQLADIVQFAKKNNVKYIFFESLVSPKLSQTIATEVGAQTLVLNPIEGLSDEDLAKGGNYLSVMRENLVNLQTALQCVR